MWPFTKKKDIQPSTEIKFESILCIPGNWENLDEFILLIVAANEGEYIAAGNVLIHPKTKRHYLINFEEQDEKLKEAFRYAGMANNVSDLFLNEIEKHKHVVYLIGSGGSFENAEHIARAGLAILKAGGLGVKIETAGKAFEKIQWEKYFDNFDSNNLYDMFVIESIYDQQSKSTFSCGMQNMGLKDTIVSEEEFQEAVNLIRIFSFYQIVDKPAIQNDQTFTPLINPFTFRITDELNQPYKENEMFGNPFGMWRLSRI